MNVKIDQQKLFNLKNKEKNIEKCEEDFRDLLDNIKRSNIYATGVSEREDDIGMEKKLKKQ